MTDWLPFPSQQSPSPVPGISGSVGEIRPAGLDEMRGLAQRRQSPILFYFKGNGDRRATLLRRDASRDGPACQTGLGYAHPDSLVGLRNGFLVAGAQSVIGTLWIILNDATLELMSTFYDGVATGMPLDHSLRNAQHALKAKAEFADPYYWAAFQLTESEHNPL